MKNPLVNDAFQDFIDSVKKQEAEIESVIVIDHSFLLNKDESAHVCAILQWDSDGNILRDEKFFVVCAINGLNYFVIYRADGQYVDPKQLLI